MKRKCVVFVVFLLLLVFSGSALAALEVIGTAVYQGSSYNLIWDDDNNGNSVIWLDYTQAQATWQNQMDWAAGLDPDGAGDSEGQLTITWNPGISVTWSDAAWRLPATVDGTWVYGCDGSTTGGYNITNSEMGHLFYTELGNLGCKDTSCNPSSGCQTGYGLQNQAPFQNLIASRYWSGLEYAANPAYAWLFTFDIGYQYYDFDQLHNGYGLALRSGQVVNGSIPTLSEWGQILLVVMLGVSALWMTRRRTLSL